MRYLAIAPVILGAACSGSTTTTSQTQPQGSVRVTVITAGLGVIPSSYQLSIDSTRTVPILANGSATVSGLTPGPHTVQLTSIALQCTSDWYAPQPVTVATDTAALAFNVRCDVPLTGSIVYASTPPSTGVGGIYVMRSDGSQVRLLASSNGATGPAVSPGGTRIAFATNTGSIQVMNADGTGLRQLTPGGAVGTHDGAPDWSPDGTQLVFVRPVCCTGTPVSLVAMTADGRSTRVLKSWPASPSHVVDGPKWSPDGTHIVYDVDQEIDILDLATGAVQNVRPPNDSSYGTAPAWSPTGDRIAYATVSVDGGCDCIEIIPSIGGAVIARWNSNGLSFSAQESFPDRPTWSRDGSRLAVDTQFGIFVVAVGGTTVTQLTPVGFFPNWTP